MHFAKIIQENVKKLNSKKNNKTMKFKYINFFLVILILTGCKKYTFSSKELQWQPYKAGDILIIESNEKTIDTIWIKEIEVYSNPNDNLALLPDYVETMFVSGEYKPQYVNQKINNDKKYFVELLKLNSQEKSYINFSLSQPKSNISYPSVLCYISDLKNKFEQKKKNIIEIKANDINDIQTDGKSFLWSKNYGYLKYNFNDGSFWELKEFIRDGKNILSQSKLVDY